MAESETDLSAPVLDAVSSFVIVVDPTGRIVRLNRACEEFAGQPRQQVIGRAIWELIALPDKHDFARDEFAMIRNGPFPVRQENRWTAVNGKHRRISWSIDAIHNSDRALHAIVYTGNEISSHAPSNGEVGEPGIWFHKAMEAAHEGIGIIDREGRLTYVNPRLAQMVGYTVDEIIGRKFFEFHADAPRGRRSTGEAAKCRYRRIIRSAAAAQERVGRLGAHERQSDPQRSGRNGRVPGNGV